MKRMDGAEAIGDLHDGGGVEGLEDGGKLPALPAATFADRNGPARLLVVHGGRSLHPRRGAAPPPGWIEHRDLDDLPGILGTGDVLVVNDAGTLPASFSGRHQRTGAPVEIRLVGSWSDRTCPDSEATECELHSWVAIAFGSGDWRVVTEARPAPPVLAVDDRLELGPALRARILAIDPAAPRWIRLRFEAPGGADLVGELFRHGRPIQYAHQDRDLDLGDVQTPLAVRPVALEAPSASFRFTFGRIEKLRAAGVTVVPITHATGISSTGDPELDARLPMPERYWIPENSALVIEAARRDGRRVIAMGTGVTRALETAAAGGRAPIVASTGISLMRLGPATRRRVVTGLVTGLHEEGSSHLELLESFADRATLIEANRQAARHRYRGHEYGDLSLILGDAPVRP